MIKTAHLNVLKFKFKNSLKISNFKFQIIFLSFFFLFFSSVIPVFAQESPDVPKNLHTYTQNVMIEVMSAMTCQLTGIDPIDPSQKCLGVDSAAGKIGFVDLPSSADSSGQAGGAIGFAGNMIAVLYTPPLHTGDYFNYLAQNFGIAKPAYAQGIGFTGLNPILNIWSAFRDIVYLLFVVVFVVIGLAIMLRLQIDPRTVMTIENQIPKIIIGLVMVTFSFAIAGFLIDMMYVTIYATHGVLQPHLGTSELDPAKMQGRTPFGAIGGLGGIWDYVKAGANSISSIIHEQIVPPKKLSEFVVLPPEYNFKCPTFDIGCWINSGLVSGVQIIGNTVGQVIGWTVSVLVGLVAVLVIGIAILWALFRLWFQLIIAYIYILIDVVFAPFWILAGLFPGSSIGFGAWLRDIVANLSAFPVAIAMFMLGKVFMNAFASPTAEHFVPPLIGNLADPKTPNLISSLIGIGIILMTPQVVTMMRDLLKAPGFKYAAAIGQAVGAGGAVPGRTVGGIGSTLFGVHYEEGKGLVGRGGALGTFMRAFGFVK